MNDLTDNETTAGLPDAATSADPTGNPAPDDAAANDRTMADVLPPGTVHAGAADGDPVGEGSSEGFADRPAAFEAAEPIEAAAEDESEEDDESEGDDIDDEDPEELAAEEEGLAEAEAAPPRATFADLGLSDPILRAVEESGYLHPTPIQEQAIPIVLMGRDVMGVAQTGTGKTAGFTLPMLDILAGSRAKARMPRSLILEPTRELALQVAENFVKYGKYLNLTHALLIGGESMNDQRDVLEKGVDVLIATPGRLIDLFERGRILLADCKVLVIDEADRMLDMGFIPDVERIVSLLPKLRQTLFFSATMAPEIRRLSEAFLSNPKEIAVSASATVATTIVAGLVWVKEYDKREALRRLIKSQDVQNALIFCNRKVDVDILYKSLKRHGFSVGALHGDLPQPVRFATLEKFKNNELQLLVCSDVAARGIDIGGLSHVFNFDVPFHAEDYVHRIGRTGRAGREGHAYTLAAPFDAKLVSAVERLTGRPIPPMTVDGLEPPTAEELREGEKAVRGRFGRGMSSRDGRSGGRDGGGRDGGGRDRGRGGDRGRDGTRDSNRDAGRDGGRDRGRGRDDRPSRSAERVLEEVTREAARGEQPPRGGDRSRAAEPRRDDRAREDRLREDRPHEDRPREDRARADRGRDEPRGDTRDRTPERMPDRAPDRAARDDRGRDDRARRFRQDDLGPAVVGFGDSTPAFMLIPVPRPRRTAETSEAEAA